MAAGRRTPKLLTFTSPHGGSGQTALCAHVALGLARSGLPVLLVEMQAPSVARHYLETSSPAEQAPVPVALGTLAAGCRQLQNRLWHLCLDPADEAQVNELRRLANRDALRGLWLIIDAPRHFEPAAALGLEADVEVRVLRADPASLVDAGAIAEAGPHVKLVLNQIDHRRPISRDIDRVLGTLLETRLAARIHYDEAVAESLAARTNVFDAAPRSSAAQAFTDLVDLLIGPQPSTEPIPAVSYRE